MLGYLLVSDLFQIGLHVRQRFSQVLLWIQAWHPRGKHTERHAKTDTKHRVTNTRTNTISHKHTYGKREEREV